MQKKRWVYLWYAMYDEIKIKKLNNILEETEYCIMVILLE